MRQVEVSRTIVFDAPRHARGFFEALVADNLDIGRPHNVEIIFGRRVRRDTWGTFRTAIDRRDNGGVIVNVFYKHSRIKQYLKDGRAMRIETVINAPRDLGCNARLPNLDELQAKARAANRRILEAERAGQGTVLASPAFERIAHPSVTADGRRTPALRLGRHHTLGDGPAPYRRGGPTGAHHLPAQPAAPWPCSPLGAACPGTGRARQRWRRPATARRSRPARPQSCPCPAGPSRKAPAPASAPPPRRRRRPRSPPPVIANRKAQAAPGRAGHDPGTVPTTRRKPPPPAHVPRTRTDHGM